MLEPEYAEIIDNYDDEEDMCNQLGLNYDEIYSYPDSNND